MYEYTRDIHTDTMARFYKAKWLMFLILVQLIYALPPPPQVLMCYPPMHGQSGGGIAHVTTQAMHST
jgi:hypothetical protein